MVRLALAFALALSFTACGGNDTSTQADAAVDGPAAGSFGAACTTVSDMSTECDSHVCTNTFNQITHPVCSVKCTMLGATDPACPNGSMGQKCNMQGYCRP